MLAEQYVAECIMRDRLAEARARAERARLLHQRADDSPAAPGIGRRLVELARALVSRGAKRASTPRGAIALPASRSGQ